MEKTAGHLRMVGNRVVGEVRVAAIGLGVLPMTLPFRPAYVQCVRTIHAALDAGLSLIDTADSYCAGPDEFGYGERLVASALAAYGPGGRDVLVATKGGHTRPDEDTWALDGSPAYLRRACDRSLRALGQEAIGLYQLHRPDPAVPYADSLGAMRELWEAGKVRMVGISNVGLDEIRLAQRILGPALVSVQNRFAPNFRSSQAELDYCTAHGLAFLAWSPLGSIATARRLGTEYEAFGVLARERGVSPQRICLAWHLHKSPTILPIPGASRPASIVDSARAMDLTLSPDEMRRLDAGPAG
jgi:aryl-alcohol dehydrogenase-like predicted oxidoreductase